MPQIWTRDGVCDALLAAFRMRPGRAVPTPSEVERALNWRRRFLERDRRAWVYFVEWGRCQVEGSSIEAHRRERGWSAKAFQNGWRRAADTIAHGLNTERVNTAGLISGDQAEERLERSGRITVTVTPPRIVVSTPRHAGH